MANPNHIKALRKGYRAWNKWRLENPYESPDLRDADLKGIDLNGTYLGGAHLGSCDFRGAILNGAKLFGAHLFNSKFDNANLSGAYLRWTVLYKASFCRADLRHSDLREASLTKTNLSHAKLSNSILAYARLVSSNLQNAEFDNCIVYGLSAWDLDTTETKQSNLIITPPEQPTITVDNLEVAQFIYLLINNEKIRNVIDTITSKAVLILGRFAPERKVVLDTLRDELRKRDYLPIIFDFDKPTDRDFTETVITLAGMSKFIIADLTQPKSSPLESYATITTYMIPFIPIIQEGEWPFAMFVDLQRKHHWVFNAMKYKDKNDIIQWLDKIIARADEKYREIQIEKAQAAQKPVSGEDW